VPQRPAVPCTTPGCPGRTITGGRCARCLARVPPRPSAAERGYGATWRYVTRPEFLARHPTCALCSQPATVPDHYPRSRRQLVRAGVPDPDAERFLRPLCDEHHRVETARRQPGLWHRDAPGQR
jgi:hypothetical protein